MASQYGRTLLDKLVLDHTMIQDLLYPDPWCDNQAARSSALEPCAKYGVLATDDPARCPGLNLVLKKQNDRKDQITQRSDISTKGNDDVTGIAYTGRDGATILGY
jgi:hypothetical protein